MWTIVQSVISVYVSLICIVTEEEEEEVEGVDRVRVCVWLDVWTIAIDICRRQEVSDHRGGGGGGGHRSGRVFFCVGGRVDHCPIFCSKYVVVLCKITEEVDRVRQAMLQSRPIA